MKKHFDHLIDLVYIFGLGEFGAQLCLPVSYVRLKGKKHTELPIPCLYCLFCILPQAGCSVVCIPKPEIVSECLTLVSLFLSKHSC